MGPSSHHHFSFDNIPCLAVKSSEKETQNQDRYVGLFDVGNMSSWLTLNMFTFLTLAATRHTLLVEELPGKVRAKDIVADLTSNIKGEDICGTYVEERYGRYQR